VLWTVGGGVVAAVVVLVALLVLTPLREWLPGYGAGEMRREARGAAVRLTALQDSLAAQQQHLAHLQQLMTGQIDSAAVADVPSRAPERTAAEPAGVPATPASEDWDDHEQPALPVARLPLNGTPPPTVVRAEASYLASLQFPALPPVNGVVTGTFDPHTGHYAIDIAVEEGTMVRAIGDGYVIMADWTHGGGYAVAVQHGDGFVSIYKHNQRLLKRVGDRVRAREAIAVSGNTGELTTGPHVHFELWHHGLAQDPRAYLVSF
jgi:murein DD-endopeptidase MepM/ murein hydrolase activator NlpD